MVLDAAFCNLQIIDACPCLYCPNGEQGCRYQESCCFKSIDRPKAVRSLYMHSRKGKGYFGGFVGTAHTPLGTVLKDSSTNTLEHTSQVLGMPVTEWADDAQRICFSLILLFSGTKGCLWDLLHRAYPGRKTT
eukprot:1153325-Pelagomonas_calceolata.AAC.1